MRGLAGQYDNAPDVVAYPRNEAEVTAVADWAAGAQAALIPFGAGSLADVVPEVIQPALEADLGQRILLDHRPGAGGNIGADVVRTAPPDSAVEAQGISAISIP